MPDRLWRVEPRLCFSKVKFPDTVAVRDTGDWVMRHFDLGDRDERWGVYGYRLTRGLPLWMYRSIRVSYEHIRKWDADERNERIAARRAEATRRLGAN